jgi:hypothetical protein
MGLQTLRRLHEVGFIDDVVTVEDAASPVDIARCHVVLRDLRARSGELFGLDYDRYCTTLPALFSEGGRSQSLGPAWLRSRPSS